MSTTFIPSAKPPIGDEVRRADAAYLSANLRGATASQDVLAKAGS